MRNQILAKRYAEGLAGALRTESEYEAVRRDLDEYSGLLRASPELSAALVRPFLALARRQEIAEDVFERLSLQAKTRRFLRLLMQHGRLRDPPGHRPGPARALGREERGRPVRGPLGRASQRGAEEPGSRRASGPGEAAGRLLLRPRSADHRRAGRAEGQPDLRRVAPTGSSSA